MTPPTTSLLIALLWWSLGITAGTRVLAQAPGQASTLADAFRDPPPEARPCTWFHVMSGNMSAPGLTKDLEAIAEVGVGGILLFNVTQGIPMGDVAYASDEHHRLLTHAARECERLGLSFGVHNCDGWSSSGGPWVRPAQSMKMVVAAEQVVRGGRALDLRLARPTTRGGFYRDIAVVAYPSLAGELDDHRNRPTLTASDPDFDVNIVDRGRKDEVAMFGRAGAGGGNGNGDDEHWVQFAYAKPKTIRSALAVFEHRHATAHLERSDDGQAWTRVRTLAINAIAAGADAILDAWDLSEFGDEAIAKLLLGEVSPSGKTPVTVPRGVGQLPFHYSVRPINLRKGYLFEEDGPLYPFGYGLSYGEIAYGQVRLSPKPHAAADTVQVRIAITNRGAHTAREVAQLYLTDEYASVTRPALELKSFQKISLAPGETRDLLFVVTPAMRSFTRLDGSFGQEAGTYTVRVGGPSAAEQSAGFAVGQ